MNASLRYLQIGIKFAKFDDLKITFWKTSFLLLRRPSGTARAPFGDAKSMSIDVYPPNPRAADRMIAAKIVIVFGICNKTGKTFIVSCKLSR